MDRLHFGGAVCTSDDLISIAVQEGLADMWREGLKKVLVKIGSVSRSASRPLASDERNATIQGPLTLFGEDIFV